MGPDAGRRAGAPRHLGQDGGVTIDPGLVAELRALARRTAVAGGDLIRSGRPETVTVAATKSSEVDPVTAMDLAVEDLIRRTLRAERPEDGLLGEEGGLRAGTSGLTWVVDPIDGTVNYLYGIPAHAVSIAVVTGEPDPASWTVVAGAVHSVADRRTWTAGRGQGADLDDRPIRVNPARTLATSLVGTGFGYTVERRRSQARALAEILPRVRDIRRFGSAAMDLCQVGSGQLDAYFERGLNPWDMAAGGLVAVEAGAVVTGLRGAPATEAMTLAGPAETVAELADLLTGLDADRD